MSVPRIFLNDGHSIPQVGFGVWQVPDEQVAKAVHRAGSATATSTTAAIYGNEEGVGRALKVTNVLATSSSSPRGVELRPGLRLDPQGAGHFLPSWGWTTWTSTSSTGRAQADRYVDTWKAMLELKESGKALSVGVCNFQPAHLQRLIDETGSRRRSTRSSCTTCSRTSSGRSTRSTASSPRTGAACLRQGRHGRRDDLRDRRGDITPPR